MLTHTVTWLCLCLCGPLAMTEADPHGDAAARERDAPAVQMPAQQPETAPACELHTDPAQMPDTAPAQQPETAPACELHTGPAQMPDTPDAAPSDAPAVPAPAETAGKTTPSREARIRELELLLEALRGAPLPGIFEGDTASPAAAAAPAADGPSVLALRPHIKVASEYVRIVDLAEFVNDPEGLAPLVGKIIVCPAPQAHGFTTVSRDKLTARLRDYSVPLDRIILTGADEVFVMRTRAAAVSARDDAPQDAAPQAGEQSAPAVTKGSPVMLLREGSMFRAEEWGSALGDGQVGDEVRVLDRKGRQISAKVIARGTVVPTGGDHE